MKRPGSIGRFVVLALMTLAFTSPSVALPPEVQSITVTDVTPRSFSVVWLATPGSTPGLTVLEAPGCEVPVATVRVEVYPTLSDRPQIAEQASGRGVMLARASALAPDTDYCFQTLTTSSLDETTPAPLVPETVRTAAMTRRSDGGSPFANDLVRFDVDLAQPGMPSDGLLLMAHVEGAGAPITGFIGDGIDDDADPATPTPRVLLDLNNVYAAASADSLDLSGDGSEGLTFLEIGGPTDVYPVHARVVPPDQDRSTITDPLVCAEAAGGLLCDGLLGDSLGGDAADAADPDAIAEVVVGSRANVDCPVCADVDFDRRLSMVDALALAQFLQGLGTLP